MPMREAQSRSDCNFTSFVTISPSTWPVKQPSAASKRFAIQKSRCASAARRSTTSWKPPETTPTFQPCACKASIKSSAPCVKCTRRYTSSNTEVGRSLSSATRACNASRKSSSPFIARAVIDAICSPIPAAAPSSSMTSSSISVESTSITSSPGWERVGVGAMFGDSCSSMVLIVGNHEDNGYS